MSQSSSKFYCTIDGLVDIYEDCDPEACSLDGPKEECPFWKELEFSAGPKAPPSGPITKCLECPFFDSSYSECYQTGVAVVPIRIHKDCPLKDYKEEEVAKDD